MKKLFVLFLCFLTAFWFLRLAMAVDTDTGKTEQLPVIAATPEPKVAAPSQGTAPLPRASALAAAEQSSLPVSALVPAPPVLKATAWLLVDFDSGVVLAQSNPHARVEPASLTKIMTIYTVAHLLREGRVKLTDSVPISARARGMTGSRMFVEAGTNISLEELMKGDIIQSGNDASVALAEYVAGSEEIFASMMNQNAARLGMTGTHYVNSTGLPDPNHYTTARDLVRLAEALIREHGDIYRWFSIKEFTYHGITQPNRNKLLWRDPTVDGIKTGYTETAGYCLAASALRDDMRLIAVVMGTESENTRADAAHALLSYGYQFYETRKLFSAGQPIKNSRVWKGEQESMPLGVAADLYVTVPRGRVQHLQSAIQFGARLVAPIRAGQQLGQLSVSLDGQTIAQRPVTALQPVAAAGLLGRTVDSIKLMFEQ